jgi:hypothetical protein
MAQPRIPSHGYYSRVTVQLGLTPLQRRGHETFDPSDFRIERASSASSLGLTVFAPVDMLGVWRKHVNSERTSARSRQIGEPTPTETALDIRYHPHPHHQTLTPETLNPNQEGEGASPAERTELSGVPFQQPLPGQDPPRVLLQTLNWRRIPPTAAIHRILPTATLSCQAFCPILPTAPSPYHPMSR